MSAVCILRLLPFPAFAVASIIWAARAPNGRKPLVVDWDMSLAAIANALTKLPHMASMLFLFALALLAVGPRRGGLAAALTFAVRITWEAVQTTVVGHNARAADMAPNLLAVLIGWLVVELVRRLVRVGAGANASRAP